MPDGEFFTGPVEDSANGEIAFSFPASYGGRTVSGVRFRFEDGKVVDASADQGEEFLLEMLDTDEGARRLGEIGIGTNFGISTGTQEILLDEKIGGTVHLAVGMSYPESGGTNSSAVHWDMVCDLREGGSITVDGTELQRDGQFLVSRRGTTVVPGPPRKVAHGPPARRSPRPRRAGCGSGRRPRAGRAVLRRGRSTSPAARRQLTAREPRSRGRHAGGGAVGNAPGGALPARHDPVRASRRSKHDEPPAAHQHGPRTRGAGLRSTPPPRPVPAAGGSTAGVRLRGQEERPRSPAQGRSGTRTSPPSARV